MFQGQPQGQFWTSGYRSSHPHPIEIDLFTNDQTPQATTEIEIAAALGSNVRINWGDGEFTVVASDTFLNYYSHDYDSTGTYTISLQGDYDQVLQIKCNNGFVTSTLTVFTPMVALVAIYLGSSDASGDIATLAVLSSLIIISAYDTTVSGDIADVAGLSLFQLNIKNSSVDTYTTPTALPAFGPGGSVYIYDLGLDQTEVDGFINDLSDGDAANGSLKIAGTNAARSSASDAAKAALLANGWTVEVNE